MSKEWVVQGVVINVHDGDTITVDVDLGWYLTYRVHVRILHINAPELSTPEGKVAQQAAASHMPAGSIVILTSHALDKYGRSLGSLALPDGTDFGQWMLDHGYAVPYEGGAR